MISLLKKDSGLPNLIRDTLQQIRDGELQLVAASLSFSTVLALIPFIAVVLAILQVVGGGFETLYPQVERLFLHNLRDAVGLEAARTVRSFLTNINAGKMGTTGGIFLLLTSLRLLRDMEVGIHRIWRHKISRRFYIRLFFYWILILGIPVVLSVYVGLRSLEGVATVSRVVPKFISTIFFLWVGLFMTYKWVPEVKVDLRPALLSSIMAALVMYGAQKTLAWATLQLFSYNKIYGSFAAIPILLIWILVLWHIILGGVAVCASLQKRHLLEESNIAPHNA